MRYITDTLKSKYCWIVFFVSMILSYFLIPSHVFYSWYSILALVFMVSFSLVVTCMVRNIKERILLARTYESSIISIIAIGIGLGALQVCGIGAPVCGAAVGIGIFSSLFPAAFSEFSYKYALHMILISIVLQLIALYFMNCFRCIKSQNNPKNIPTPSKNIMSPEAK